MIVIMKAGATAAEIGAVIARVEELGLTPHPTRLAAARVTLSALGRGARLAPGPIPRGKTIDQLIAPQIPGDLPGPVLFCGIKSTLAAERRTCAMLLR